jgi:hypothetical protein
MQEKKNTEKRKRMGWRNVFHSENMTLISFH